MPHIKFTDTNVGAIPTPDKTVWYTDPEQKGLRLCVTKTGVKTWYVNKWDPTANKVRSVKLAQWASKVTHCKWAKDQRGLVAHGIVSGDVLNKAEARAKAAVEQANALPTFREALEQFIEHRTTSRQSGKARMMETTAKDYRATFNKHLAQWADVHVDRLPILEINQYLNAVQITRPNAAHVAATVAGATVRFINKLCALALPIPSLLEGTKMRSRVETGKLDMQVPWEDRWDEIEEISNEHIRLCWKITWYTGFRGRGLRALTWDQVDLDDGVVTFERLKRQEVVHVRKNGVRGLKTAHSERLLPLLGVSLDAAHQLAAMGGWGKRLGKNMYATSVINRALRSSGIVTDKRQSLYSLRHWFQDQLTKRDVVDRAHSSSVAAKVSAFCACFRLECRL